MFVKDNKSMSEETADTGITIESTKNDFIELADTGFTMEATTNGSTELADTGITIEATTNGSIELADIGTDTSTGTDDERNISDFSSFGGFSSDHGNHASDVSEVQLSLVVNERCQQCRCVRTVMRMLKLEFDVERVNNEHQYKPVGPQYPLYSLYPVLKEGETFKMAEG